MRMFELIVEEKVISRYTIEAKTESEAKHLLLEGDAGEAKIIEYIDDNPIIKSVEQIALTD